MQRLQSPHRDWQMHIRSLSLAGEEVKRLRSRVDALESLSGTTSARTSRLSASADINGIETPDSSYIERSSAGSTITRSDNGINLGAGNPRGGSWSGSGPDGAALQRAVQQLVRTELQSDAVRGKQKQNRSNTYTYFSMMSLLKQLTQYWPQLIMSLHRNTCVFTEGWTRSSGTKRQVFEHF